MSDFINFCSQVLLQLVDLLFSIDVGGYSYGDFLVACMLVSVLVSSLIVRFAHGGGGSVLPPPRAGNSSSRGSAD